MRPTASDRRPKSSSPKRPSSRSRSPAATRIEAAVSFSTGFERRRNTEYDTTDRTASARNETIPMIHAYSRRACCTTDAGSAIRTTATSFVALCTRCA